MLRRFDRLRGARVSWLSILDAVTSWMPSRICVSDDRLHVKIGRCGAGCRVCLFTLLIRSVLGGPRVPGTIRHAKLQPKASDQHAPEFAPMLNRFPHFEPASYAAFKSNGIAPQPFASSAPQSANGSGRASAANHAIKCRHRPMLNSMTARDRRSCPGLPSSIPINGIRLRWQSAD